MADTEQPQPTATPTTDVPQADPAPAPMPPPVDNSWLVMDIIEHSRKPSGEETRLEK